MKARDKKATTNDAFSTERVIGRTESEKSEQQPVDNQRTNAYSQGKRFSRQDNELLLQKKATNQQEKEQFKRTRQ